MATKKNKRTRESSPARSMVTRAPKPSSVDSNPAIGKANTPEDWLRQEATEAPPKKRVKDAVDDALGRSSYQSDPGRQDWLLNGNSFKVSRFYWHEPAIAYDLPASVEEMRAKAEFFAKTDITYLAVAPNESLTQEALVERLQALFDAKGKKKALAAA